MHEWGISAYHKKTQCLSMMRCLDDSNLLVVSKLSHILTNK